MVIDSTKCIKMNSRSGSIKSKWNPYLYKWKILFNRSNKEWISFEPKPELYVYPCYACRDMFGLKSSFLDHVNRRAILITYKCNFCSDMSLTFFNPCSLLLHVRQHFNSATGQINLDNVEISMLPLGLAGFLPNPSIPLLYDVKEDNLGQNMYINNKFYQPLPNQKGKRIIDLVSNELQFVYQVNQSRSSSLIIKQTSSNIPKCQFILLDNGLRTDCSNSLTDNDVTVKEEPEEIIESNNNYFGPIITKIETLEHSDIEDVPKVESETTCEENNDQTFLQSYPQCPECKLIQKDTMISHFIQDNKPSEFEGKCSVCKYIAPTKCSLQAHERIHKNEAPFVCPDCGEIFNDDVTLNTHLKEICFHLDKNIRIRCPGKRCGKIFAQINNFFTHFVIHLISLCRCPICKNMFPTVTQCLQHNEETHEKPANPEKLYSCTVCHEGPIFDDKEKISHMAEHGTDIQNSVYVYVCKYCRSYFRSTLTYITHSMRCRKFLNLNSHQNQQKPPAIEDKQSPKQNVLATCELCKDKFETLDEHGHCKKCQETTCPTQPPDKSLNHSIFFESINSTGMENGSRKMRCLLCKNLIKVQDIDVHVSSKECKFCNALVIIESRSLTPDKNVNSVKTESPKSDDSPKKKRRKNLSFYSKPKKKAALDPQADELKPFDGTYYCQLCNYSETNRADFHKHLLAHRDISTAYQCMECGDCFVVKPSLIKHLGYYHNIFDTESYFQENNCFDKNAVQELEAAMKLTPCETKEPVAENQCRVCLKQCSDKRDLNKHLRTHGMAFVMTHYK